MSTHNCPWTEGLVHPLASLPRLNLTADGGITPDEAQCLGLWDKYAMPDHIRNHSAKVAEFAVLMAQRAVDRGFAVDVAEVRASALLHDIAKNYTIAHGGSHAQIGASWVVLETGNRRLGQGVIHHVHWPWSVDETQVCSLPFFIIYADKRVKHHSYVSLAERFEDLLDRYGRTEPSRASIRTSYDQGKTVERALSALLELDIHAYTPDSGRLV